MSPAEQVLATLWRRRVTFVVSFVATLVAAAAVTFSLPKVYDTHSFLLITPTQETGSQFAAVELTETLAKTYAELLQSPQVADAVAEELPFARSGESLENAVSVSPVSGSQLLQIEAEAETPEEAQVIANTYASVFSERAREIGGERTAPAKLAVAEPAFLPRSPSRPKPLLYMLVGSVFALMVAVGVTLLRERLSQRLAIDASTTEVFGLPVLGRVPKSRSLAQAFRAPGLLENGALTEPFRLLHTNISFEGSQQRPYSLAIVSPELGEGKSVCAANLAAVSADLERSVLLVDADLRLQALSSELGMAGRSPGLSSLLTGRDGNSVVAASARQKGRSNLHFLPAGPSMRNPTALLGSPALDAVLDRAAAEFDLLVYDCPPLDVGADASLLAASVDGVLLVVDAERSDGRSVMQAIAQLRRASANVLGVVINRASGTRRDSPYFQGANGAAPRSETSNTPELRKPG